LIQTKYSWLGRIISISLLVTLAIPLLLLSQEVRQPISNALEIGDTTRAISLLEEDIKMDPSYDYNYYVLGQIYMKQKNYNAALEQFELAVKKNKKFYEGRYALGLVQLELGKIDEAEKNFRTGLKKSKKMKADFHNGIGLVFMARGEFNEADKEVRQAIILDSTNAEFHINLGNINFANKIYPLATMEYETALQLDTASLEVYFNWAEACLEMKDYTCALDKLSTVLQKDSTFAEAWMRAGGIYYKAARSTRNFNDAKPLYENTIGSYNRYMALTDNQTDSTSGRAFYEAGMSYLILGGFPEAQKDFATVLSIPVEPKDIYFYYARSFQGNKDYDSAITYYDKHISWVSAQGEDYESGIRDVELYRRLGECYQQKKDHYNTIDYYKKSLEYDSTQARLLYGVAVAYNYNQDYANAVVYYMKRFALGTDERYWSLYYNAAMAALYLVDKGGSAMASDDEDMDLDLEEDEGMVEPVVDLLAGVDLPRLAVEYLDMIANDYWEHVISNEKNKKTAVKALNMLGSTYLYQLNDCVNGKKYLERVLEVDPDYCDAKKSLGYAYFGELCTQNFSKALTYLNQALACNLKAGKSRGDDVSLLLWIAQTYHFRAVERQGAKQPKEQYQKDYENADNFYSEVLKFDPNNQEAKDGFRQVKWEH